MPFSKWTSAARAPPAITRPLLSTSKTYAVTAKSSFAYVLILGILAVTVAASIPTFIVAIQHASGVVHALLLTALILSLVVFWLFGLYNIIVTLLGYARPLAVERTAYEPFADEPVALVYPTYNDFSPTHLDESRKQTHGPTRTYIVDDSTDATLLADIDAYAAARDDVTVIRRDGRSGFKGGAINHALASVIDEPYFVLMDSDEVLPPEFIEQAFTYFATDDVGFVQANHDYNRTTATVFGRELGIGVDIHWDVYQRIRNRYGFVMLLGHGALLRRDVWEAIDGFPEIVSEDLAFATRARKYGFYGVFAEDITCLEDFPVDYEAFRKRHKKWTAGSIEYITTRLPSFLVHPAPTRVEKLDVLIPTLQLPLTVVFLLYIFTVGALELAYGAVIPPEVGLPLHLGVITIATLLSPIYCYIIGLRHRPRKLLRFAAISTTVYTSVAVTAVLHGSTVLLGRRATFLTTPKQTSDGIAFREYIPTIAVGVVTFAIALKVGLLVGAVALAWVLSPALSMFNEDRPLGQLSRLLCLLPPVLLAVGITVGAVTVASAMN